MNQLQGIRSSKRIFVAIRNSLSSSYQQSPLSKTELRLLSSGGNGGGDGGDNGAGETKIPGAPQEPDLPFKPRRRSRFASPEDDNSFLDNFKVGFEDEKGKNQRREEASPPSPPENADEIFRRMKENGLIPNAVAMLDGLCQDGLVQEAMKLFGLMREKGTIPEVVVYTAVVDGFCKAEKLDDAIRVFRKMQSNGIVANAFSYGVLVQGLCKCKRTETALEFCLEMLEAGHSPNLATFVGLVDGVCEAKGVEEGREVIRKLREKGFFLNDKALREFLEKKAAVSPEVWEVILGKKAKNRRLF